MKNVPVFHLGIHAIQKNFLFLVKSNNTGFCYTAELNSILHIRPNCDGIKVVFAFYRIEKLIQKGRGYKMAMPVSRLVENDH